MHPSMFGALSEDESVRYFLEHIGCKCNMEGYHAISSKHMCCLHAQGSLKAASQRSRLPPSCNPFWRQNAGERPLSCWTSTCKSGKHRYRPWHVLLAHQVWACHFMQYVEIPADLIPD